jgi:hypothetical protein
MGDEPTPDDVTPEDVTPPDRVSDHTTEDATGEGRHVDDDAEGDAARRDEAIVDELPEDLDAAGYVGPYLFPDNNRRRVPGYLYLASAGACAALWLLVDDSPFVNGGMLLAAVLLAVLGGYHLLAGWNLDVDEQDALVIAGRTVGFPVGHASAQMGWRGLRSRPLWRILLYSAENPPTTRGLVLVDGVDGTVVEHFVEENPEDWSELDGGIGPGD